MEASQTLVSTRGAMHRIAEHVLSPARYAEEGRIGLRPSPYGIETPPLGPAGRVLALDGPELVLTDGAGERRAPVSTLRAAAVFFGVTPGAPAHVYTPNTPLELDAELVLDPAAQLLLADWFTLGDAVLARFCADVPEDAPTEATLWPEHFDLGIVAAEVNYGFSPGDEYEPMPYVYVGPHAGRPAGDEFWNAPFGAMRSISSVGSLEAALAFLHEGRDRARKS
jgi:hypothetical protein